MKKAYFLIILALLLALSNPCYAGWFSGSAGGGGTWSTITPASTDINSSGQVVGQHLTNPLPVANGGTAASTAAGASVTITGDPATGYTKYTHGGTWTTSLPLTVYMASSGTAATIVNTSTGNSMAALTFGTQSPSITLSNAGVYQLGGYVNLLTASATYAANQSISCEIYRTNNTPAAITGTVSYSQVPIITTLSIVLPTITIPNVYYTATAGDNLAVYCMGSALTGAGSVTSPVASGAMVGAAISATGLFQ